MIKNSQVEGKHGRRGESSLNRDMTEEVQGGQSLFLGNRCTDYVHWSAEVPLPSQHEQREAHSYRITREDLS